jgi:signal peptidase I
VTHTDIGDQEDKPAVEVSSAHRRDSEPTSLKSAAWELIQTVVLAVVLFLLIRNVVQNFRIDGISMEPNFHNGQFLIVNRFAYCPGLHLDINPLNINLEKTWCVRQPKRGDVIVFEYPKDLSRDFIKRVIGLPGDTVEVRGGKIYINGQLMPEPFGPNPGSSTDGPITVGPNELFVMGDNRNNSSDSRTWGSLPLEYVIGKALLSYWPPRYWAVVPRYDLTELSASTP